MYGLLDYGFELVHNVYLSLFLLLLLRCLCSVYMFFYRFLQYFYSRYVCFDWEKYIAVTAINSKCEKILTGCSISLATRSQSKKIWIVEKKGKTKKARGRFFIVRSSMKKTKGEKKERWRERKRKRNREGGTHDGDDDDATSRKTYTQLVRGAFGVDMRKS